MVEQPKQSYVWMIDVMVPFLVKELHASQEEIDYLKLLYSVKLKRKENITTRPGPRKPSTIIEDFLYHGDFGHAQNSSLLQEMRIENILNICDQALNKDISTQFNVLWISIDDTMTTDISKHFDRTTKFLRSCKEKGERVLVNCQMGISRSSTIILAYLLEYHFQNLSEAYDHLVQCRRIVSPNLNFLIQLIRYERALEGRTKSLETPELSVNNSKFSEQTNGSDSSN